MRYICLAGMALVLLLQCPVGTFAAETTAPKKIHPDAVPKDSEETARMWNTARKYKQQMRFELARQHYLLALSACRSEQTMERIQRELQIVELQIRSMR